MKNNKPIKCFRFWGLFVGSRENGMILFAITLAVTIGISSNCAAATEFIVHSGESIQDAVSNSKAR